MVAAVGAVGWAFGSFLHLIAATEADRIAADQSAPLTDALIPVETVTVPIFAWASCSSPSSAWRTALVGNRTAAACAVVGGVPALLQPRDDGDLPSRPGVRRARRVRAHWRRPDGRCREAGFAPGATIVAAWGGFDERRAAHRRLLPRWNRDH